MFGSVILDVVVAMAFLYLILSLACSALNEIIATVLHLRAKDLATGVRSLVGSEAERQKLYNHALIKALVPDAKKRIDPSYIPSRTFALALLDHLAQRGGGAGPREGAPEAQAPAPAEQKPVARIRAGLTTADSSLAQSLNALIADAGEDLKALQKGVERWFNDTMDRAGGWYKRRVQTILLGLAVVVTVGLNADTLMMGNALLRDATLRATVVAAAGQYVQRAATDTGGAPVPSVDSLRAQLSGLQLPIGWSYGAADPRAPKSPHREPKGLVWWLTKVLGLGITALAVSLGAPFWFDVLNKVTKLRGSGEKPKDEDKPAEAGAAKK